MGEGTTIVGDPNQTLAAYHVAVRRERF